MRKPDLEKALESFSSIIAAKQQLSDREREIVAKVNRAMSSMGYQIVSSPGQPSGKRRGRPVGSRNKRRKLAMHETAHNGIGRIPRRGPGLKKVA